jgi:photosystem II stability/assembly factor-like uncharacterized protein
VRTEDGGVTWTTVDTQFGQRLWDVSFADDVAFVCGANGLLLRSDDFGATWSQISSGAAHTARGISVVDGHRGWIAHENGEIALTTNGGSLWERIQVDGFDEFGDLWCIDFHDSDNGWVAGMQQSFGLADDGQIARSTDGGRTWSLQFVQSAFEFFGLEALDNDTCIAFGRGNFASSTFIRTDDGGQTWFPSGPTGTVNGFRDAYFLPDGQTGWLVGNGIHRTDDGGATWTLQFNSPVMLASVSFSDARNGWASGFQNTLFRTTNGGTTWVAQNAGGPAGAAYMGVSAVGPQEAYLVGWNRFVAHSTDGGSTWTPVALPPLAHNLYQASSVEWNDVEFIDGGNGWIVGNEGVYAIRDGRSLVAVPNALSVAAGGQQTFTMRPGSEHGGELFVLMGTFSGTSPGFVDPNSGLTVPIVYDAYTNLLLTSWGGGIVTPLFGLVGSDGYAESRFRLPAGTDPSFAGLTVHHAFFTLDIFGSGLMEHASNAESLELLP